LDPLPEDHPVKADDFVVLDYEGFEGDRAMDGIQASNFLLKVGSNRFHPEFEKSLVGLKKGDEADISVDFEDDYHHNSLAGKKVRFKVKLLDVKEMVLPDLDDAFAQGISKDFKTLDDLKSKLRESLGDQEEKRIDRAVKQHLMEKISEGVQIELPHTLVESEVAYAVENVKQNLQRSGSSIEKAGLSEQKLREEFRPAAEKRVKEMLILGEIANQEGLSVDEQDLAEGFEELAANTGQDAETLRKYYEARGMLDSLKENLLEQKTLNYLVEHAKISEVDKALANNQKPSEKQEGDQ
jgi:trigger factor